MNLSDEQIEKIAEYGKNLTPISDVAVLMALDEDELREELSCKWSSARLAYEGGRAKTQMEIRAMEINMAVNGSPMAVQHVRQYMDDLVIKNDM